MKNLEISNTQVPISQPRKLTMKNIKIRENQENSNFNKIQNIVNQKNEKVLNISYKNIILPFNKCRNETMKINYSKYLIIKEFIYDNLCIKSIVSKLDEIEKLKVYLLDLDEMKLFNDAQRPLPFESNPKSIWTKETFNKKY